MIVLEGRVGFLSPPKAGADWIFASLQKHGFGVKSCCRGPHGLRMCKDCLNVDVIFAVVRHPQEWLSDVYSALCQYQFFDPPMWHFNSADTTSWPDFVRWVSARANTCRDIFGTYTKYADMALRYERLGPALIRICHDIDGHVHPFGPPPAAPERRTSPGLARSLEDSDAEFIEEYYR